jgi:phosphate uptake regulator
MTREKIQKTKEFNLETTSKQTDLLRGLIAAYIAGYTSIKITSSVSIPSDVRVTARKFTQTTIGQEIVEETDTYIFIKDLLNPSEMPFDRTIKRMHIIVKGMHEDAMRSLKTNDRTLASEVVTRDYEVNRLHWLVARQYNSILQNVSLAEKMNVTIGLSSSYYLISRIIERIGDHVVKIAINVQNLIENTKNEKLIDHIQSASDLALDIFNRSIGSFFRKDIKGSNENIDLMEKLHGLCEEIDTLALVQKGIVAISVGYIAESIRRIGEYAEDISESVINYLISIEK